jgi:hypothetical protein
VRALVKKESAFSELMGSREFEGTPRSHRCSASR